jgi:hypothetical protein
VAVAAISAGTASVGSGVAFVGLPYSALGFGLGPVAHKHGIYQVLRTVPHHAVTRST